MANQKCERWAQALVDSLSLRYGALYVVTKAYDASKDVYVKVALVAGGNNSVKALIKLVAAAAPASGAYDSLGLAQTVYTPHIAQVLFDTTVPVTTTERFYALRAADVLGTRVEVYEKAAGAGNIAIADVAAAQFIVGADNTDLYSGALSNL